MDFLYQSPLLLSNNRRESPFYIHPLTLRELYRLLTLKIMPLPVNYHSAYIFAIIHKLRNIHRFPRLTYCISVPRIIELLSNLSRAFPSHDTLTHKPPYFSLLRVYHILTIYLIPAKNITATL